jgi:hypothetical protein
VSTKLFGFAGEINPGHIDFAGFGVAAAGVTALKLGPLRVCEQMGF